MMTSAHFVEHCFTSNSCEIKISIFLLSAQFEAGWIASVCIIIPKIINVSRE